MEALNDTLKVLIPDLDPKEPEHLQNQRYSTVEVN